MINKVNVQLMQPKSHYFIFVPLIILAAPVLSYQRKNEDVPQEKLPKSNEQKSKSFTVTKYEVSDNKIKFFDAKGLFKKHWVLVKEIPIQEITGIDSFGNELNIAWNDVVYLFVFKRNAELCVSLRDQIRGLLEEQQKNIESTEKDSASKRDLDGVINTSLSIVDTLFDILMGLHKKRVDWTLLESYTEGLGKSLNFIEQPLVPLDLDFSKVSDAIKRHFSKETSKEAYKILTSIYNYFNKLKPDDDQKESNLNFEKARDVILAYYILNDCLFGKVVGEMNNANESLALESAVLHLASKSSVKVNVEELNISIDKFGSEVDNESTKSNVRMFFKEQLKKL